MPSNLKPWGLMIVCLEKRFLIGQHPTYKFTLRQKTRKPLNFSLECKSQLSQFQVYCKQADLHGICHLRQNKQMKQIQPTLFNDPAAF